MELITDNCESFDESIEAVVSGFVIVKSKAENAINLLNEAIEYWRRNLVLTLETAIAELRKYQLDQVFIISFSISLK
jgi:hypothetical protein